MDRILKQNVNDLIISLGIPSQNDAKDFEVFSSYSVLSKEYNRSFEIEDVVIGDGGDTGIDGISIIVNGQIVTTRDEVDQAANQNIEVTYIFIQSKSSKNFDSGDIHKFCVGVLDFFADSPKLIRNQDIEKFADISNYVLSKAKFFKINPICKLFYVTTGTWLNDSGLVGIISMYEQQLQETNLFSSIQISMYGSNEISKAYRDSKNPISANITFEMKVTLPELPGISEAYYGILPFQEFRKLIVDENDGLNNVFYDNVRDFQGLSNTVNKTIAETLASETPDLFAVLNNGVTIVASSLNVSGNKFYLTDYQIVNGCQTSNVLYEYRNDPKLQDLKIPLKLISTANDDVKTKITIATNNQTAIKRESLQAMTNFQKNLEQYYATFKDDERLYYERRVKQYQSDPLVPRSKIITLQNQIKAFSSMFLENPHMVTNNFGKVVKDHIEKNEAGVEKAPEIFHPDHKYLPYYVAALAEYRLDSLLKDKTIDPKYRKVKYFLIMLFRMQINKEPMYQNTLKSDKKSEQYCQPILSVLRDKNKWVAAFKATTDIWDKSGLDIGNKELVKRPSTTSTLKSLV